MLRFGLIIAALVLTVDQVSKWVVVQELMQPPQVFQITGFLNVVMVWNRGVSFGMLNAASGWMPYILIALSLVISVFLIFWLRRTHRRAPALALGMVIGGAVGNALDRVVYGAVADFIDLHIGGWHWPAFNVADAGISVGVIFLLYDSLFLSRESPK